MNETEQNFLKVVGEAVAEKDSERLSEAVSDFSSFCFKDVPPPEEGPPFSDDWIAGLSRLIGSTGFLELADSFKLLALFQNDWGRISPAQRLTVCKLLAEIYEKLKDDTAQLVIAELLGEYLADAQGLQALDQLRSVSNEIARAHVAHGYKCLSKCAADAELKSAAQGRLAAMAKDPSGIVKREVVSALASLSRQR